MEILRPLLAETGAEPIGKVVIGTVKGDIHDIGKNLVAMMLEGAGFEVFDIGINSDVDKFFAALDEHQPRHPRDVGAADHDDAVHEGGRRHADRKGLRDDYIVMVGGAPLNEEFGTAVGADAYCRDAAITAEIGEEPDRRPAAPVRRAARPVRGRDAAPLVSGVRRAGVGAARRARPTRLPTSRCATSRPTSTTGPSASSPS